MESSYLRAVVVLSAAGLLLVPVFGLLLRLQPHFVHGLHVSSSTAETNCYIVGGLYAVVFVISSLLLILKTRGCFDKKSTVIQDDIDKRNRRYGLPFTELESKDFVRAMDAMDRRTAVVSTPEQDMELPTKAPDETEPL
ncbi:hypothetical protein PHMEG_0009612 [Phytophthora megakarya]|uniref:Transmembrane protein n=1 Tax=Phytophthora megakarya TaxID=4795 RepID=A0A225WH72_9STRA|nr:hypothetical protein PHMEG_0009612 [Phytophthora megakarya]